MKIQLTDWTRSFTKNNLWRCGCIVMAVAILAFAGCDRDDEPIPAYLTIQPFKLNATNLDRHGSISEKITNARVFLRNPATNETQQIGTVSLPATIPVLAWGEVEINVDPVIKANGNTFYLQIYPFYERYTATINLAANDDTSVSPVTTYKDDAFFELIEDFEQPGILFENDLDDNPATFVERTTEDVFEGEFSGKVSLDTANNVIVAATNELYDLSFSEVGRVYMEVNYKTDVPLEFGLLAVDDQGVQNPVFEFVVLAKDEWNKIYFDMTDLISTSGTNRFLFMFRGGIPFEQGGFTLNEAEIFLDNIKVVHF